MYVMYIRDTHRKKNPILSTLSLVCFSSFHCHCVRCVIYGDRLFKLKTKTHHFHSLFSQRSESIFLYCFPTSIPYNAHMKKKIYQIFV